MHRIERNFDHIFLQKKRSFFLRSLFLDIMHPRVIGTQMPPSDQKERFPELEEVVVSMAGLVNMNPLGSSKLPVTAFSTVSNHWAEVPNSWVETPILP